MEYYINTNGELTHWGIKGMKWGVRRYQNKDGSLTPAGKKRRAKLEGELEKLGGGKKTESEDAPKKKSVSEMSNKELQEYTTRMQLEKNYHDAQKQLAASMPQKQVSKGQKMAESLLNEAVLPAVKNAGRSYLEKLLKEKAGINTEDPVAALEKTWKKLDYEQKIDKIKNPDKYLSEEDKNKRQTRDFDAETREANRQGYATVTDKAKAEKASREKADADAANEAARAANNAKSEEYYDSTYRKSTGERTDTNPNANRGMSTVNDYKDTPVTSISTTVRNNGKARVDSILDKNGDEIFSFYFDGDDD